MLERKGGRTPLGRRITLYRLKENVEHYLDVLRKFLRLETIGGGIALEERVWHAPTTHSFDRDQLVKGFMSLMERGNATVYETIEEHTHKLYVPEMSKVLYQIGLQINWYDNAEKNRSSVWFAHHFGFSDTEHFWWIYLNRPEAATYIAEANDVDLILW